MTILSLYLFHLSRSGVIREDPSLTGDFRWTFATCISRETGV